MSGLWDWWRRVREPASPDNQEVDEEVVGRQADGGEAEDDSNEKMKEAEDSSEFEDDKEYAEIEELIRAAEEEAPTVECRDAGFGSSPCSEQSGDYDEVKEVSELMTTAVEDMEEVAGERQKSDTEQTWSEEECSETQAPLVPTVKLTLDLRVTEDRALPMEETCTPLYEPSPCLHSADAKLAPVYATVAKLPPVPPERPSSLQPTDSTHQPSPPPVPPPDWDDVLEKKDVVWRMGRMKKVKKWIGDSKVNIPNRLSKMLSQDYLCHQVPHISSPAHN